jgi:predicted transcriptional regulator
MPNIERKRSNYEYQVPPGQLDALLDIAMKKDRDIQTLIWDALDEYIQREEQTWQK